jgi:hypothetical protein
MKKWLSPFLFLLSGLFIVAAGFVYDVEFAGIPYQDPTPEMLTRYNHQAHIASMICLVGFCAFLFGIFLLLKNLIARWKKN